MTVRVEQRMESLPELAAVIAFELDDAKVYHVSGPGFEGYLRDDDTEAWDALKDVHTQLTTEVQDG